MASTSAHARLSAFSRHCLAPHTEFRKKCPHARVQGPAFFAGVPMRFITDEHTERMLSQYVHQWHFSHAGLFCAFCPR
jgi:hypothetical protein